MDLPCCNTNIIFPTRMAMCKSTKDAAARQPRRAHRAPFSCEGTTQPQHQRQNRHRDSHRLRHPLRAPSSSRTALHGASLQTQLSFQHYAVTRPQPPRRLHNPSHPHTAPHTRTAAYPLPAAQVPPPLRLKMADARLPEMTVTATELRARPPLPFGRFPSFPVLPFHRRIAMTDVPQQ